MLMARSHASEELPHLDDVIQRVFPISDETLATEAELDRHFREAGTRVRAGVVLLLKDLRCGGRPCKQTTKWGACTYLDQAIRSIGSLVQPESLVAKYPQYPVLLYHSDWLHQDQIIVERACGLNSFSQQKKPYRAWWQRVTFGPESLPPYLYDVNRTVAGWRELHVAGDLSRATKKNIHGFGYMLMCRLYGGLIHHAPLARKLDYYLRVDGDSRLTSVQDDPFLRMHNTGKKYATFGRGGYKEVAGAAVALPRELSRRYDGDASIRYRKCPSAKVACPTIAILRVPRAENAAATRAGECNLNCQLTLPSNRDPSSRSMPFPVPLCSRPQAKGPVQCPAFYNNFEIVDMRAFRTPLQLSLVALAQENVAVEAWATPSFGRSKSTLSWRRTRLIT
ncbi:hypothetical protein CTAYLR_000769 [Chrysophaeum taylorii]|uniref:Uncharacterized protein n=1 Tax=Chrysophaeum taylorii TaxID=2483200 RepID=A0AAD7XUV6_9STRA|nr:hypothetical protein CTAYLR_000769 [Chrysophaeum taylorii]